MENEEQTQQESIDAKEAQAREVAKSTAIMSGCILASRVTGFIRTWAMAFALGNTVLAAGFSLANNLPNMIYELVAGGVLSTAFLPIYFQQRNQKGLEAGSNYASNLLSVVVVVLGAIAVLASIFAPQIMLTQTLFSAKDNSTVESAVWLFRFLAFEILFYGISAVFSGILNAEREYFWPNINSLFMNIISIIGFFGYPFIAAVNETAAINWLGAMMLLSIAVLAFIQLPAIHKSGIKLKFVIKLDGEGLKDTIKLALPAISCTAINLVALSFMNSCALHVSDTGPASVSYAWMWYQFPYGVLGVALSTALFTELSDCAGRKDWDRFREHFLAGLRTTWLLIIPMAALVLACSEQLVGLYASGKFTADDIGPVSRLLCGWAMCLPAYAAYMFVYRAYSAMKDMKTVAICNLCFTVIQVLGYMTFTGVLWDGALSQGLPGIAFGDFSFYILMLVTLLAILKHRAKTLDLKGLVVPVIKVSIASILGAVVAIIVGRAVMGIFYGGDTLTAFGNLIISGVAGLAVILIISRLLHVDEITRMLNAVLRKIKH